LDFISRFGLIRYHFIYKSIFINIAVKRMVWHEIMYFRWVAQHCFQSVAISFSHKSPHFSLLSSTSPCELYEREVTFFSNLKVVRALKCLSEVLYICANVTKNIYQHLSFSLSLFMWLRFHRAHTEKWKTTERSGEIYGRS
jgi:hypothetical protein